MPTSSVVAWSGDHATTEGVGLFFRFGGARQSTQGGSYMEKFKPTRSQAIDPTAGDGVAGDGVGQAQPLGTKPLDMSNSTMAEQIAQVAIAFEQRRTGHQPQSATVV